MPFFVNLNPILQSLIATLFTYFITLLGVACVFFFKKLNQKALDLSLGFAAGVMIASSFWSLLLPSINLSASLGYLVWLFPSLGFILGGIFVILADIFVDKELIRNKKSDTSKRSLLLISAITLHNIPEGLAIGVAFGSIVNGNNDVGLLSACFLTLGVAIQNFPEGASVSLPLLKEGYSKKKSFFYGQASGFVEPIAGVIGALLSVFIKSILPFLLSFAAGCMISVAGRELLPEASKEHKNYATIGLVFGFVLMMALETIFEI